MNSKGKIINVAWLVVATSTFGAHLGFIAGVEATMILLVIISKLSAGICAVIISLFFMKYKDKNISRF